MSSQPRNDKLSSDDGLIPDVELTTASEVDGKPFEDNNDGHSEQDEDQKQKVVHCSGHKVGSFLLPYAFDLIKFNRFPSASLLIVLR